MTERLCHLLLACHRLDIDALPSTGHIFPIHGIVRYLKLIMPPEDLSIEISCDAIQ